MRNITLLTRLQRRVWAHHEPSWQIAWKLMEEEALLLLGGERLTPLHGKVMLTSFVGTNIFPDEAPTQPEKQAIIRWGVKRKIISAVLSELRSAMAPQIRRLTEIISDEIDLLIGDLFEGRLTYAGFAEVRLAHIHEYEIRLAALLSRFAADNVYRNRRLNALVLL